MNTIKIPNVLLPNSSVDMNAWAVNACDQYTSNYDYWHEVEKLVGDKYSTLNLIYPEIYLKDQPEKRIAKINDNMRNYLSEGVFYETQCMVLVERTTQNSGTRTGIVLAIDLEDYSFTKGDKTLIRSTEATILERIPPRVKIRQNAAIELPHVMLLYDDKNNSVLNKVKRGKTLYDFELNMGGGSVKGTQIVNPDEIVSAFSALIEDRVLQQKYGVDDKLLFAVGDGNHSLATAKTCWESVKASLPESEWENCPARYALCEVVNVYDAALAFQPIFRFVKTDKPFQLKSALNFTGRKKATVLINGVEQEIAFCDDVPEGIRELDLAIARFIEENGGDVDYIHGENELFELSKSGLCVVVPAIEKDDFFKLIIKGGNLPKKTFSMGEGYEKRYYIEAKKIR